MKKILLAVTTLLLLTIFLVGCGEVTYTVRIEDGGARIYRYSVKLDPSDADVDKQRGAVRALFSYYQGRIDRATFTESDPNLLVLEIKYDNLTDYYIANGITGDEPNEPSEWEKEGVLFQKYFTTLAVADKGSFANYALSYLQNYDDTFQTKYVAKAYAAANNGTLSAVYSNVVKDAVSSDEPYESLRLLTITKSSYVDEACDTAYDWMKELGYDFATINAYFAYSMVYKNVEGLDPDEVYEENGQTVYKWKLDPLTSNEFTLTQTVPSVWVWELLAIIAGLIIAAICMVLVVLKKKAKGKDEPTKDEKEETNNDAFDFSANTEEKIPEDDSEKESDYGE